MKKLFWMLSLFILLAMPSYATISSTTTRTITATGNGSTTTYTIGFTFQDNTEVVVYKITESTGVATLVTQGAGATKYTVSGGNPGTSVVMGTAPSTDEHLVIYRATPVTQTVNYDENSPFPADDHEEQMDHFAQMIQESEATATSYPRYSTVSSGDIVKYDGTNWLPYNLDTALSHITAGGSVIAGPGSTTNLGLVTWSGTNGLALLNNNATLSAGGVLTLPALTGDRVIVSNSSSQLSTSTFAQVVAAAGTPSVDATSINGIPISTSTIGVGKVIAYNGSTLSYSTVSENAGLYNSSGSNLYRSEFAAFSCSGSSTIARQSGTWISSLGNRGTKHCNMGLTAGTFTDLPVCVCNNSETSIPSPCGIIINSLTSLDIYSQTVADADFNATVICTGRRD